MSDNIRAAMLNAIAENDTLLEVGRKAIEKQLVEWRDLRMSAFGRNNGLVIRERDGKDSWIIRMGPEDAMRTGLLAISKAITDSDAGGVE